MIDELKLNEQQAEKIIDKAIEFEIFTDEVPDTKKDKLNAAHEIVAFSIDAWVDDDMTPDSDDEEKAAAGKEIAQIFKLAGVKIDDEGEITYGKVPAAKGASKKKEEEPEEDDDEAPFDMEDLIEGYDDLSAAAKLKAIKALELDPEDDDDYNTLVGIADYEEEQDKPSSRVLDYLNDIVPPEDSDGDDDEQDEDETADEAGDDSDDDTEDGEDEPYDEESLNDMDKDDLKEVAEEFGVDFPKRLTSTGKKKVVAAILEAQEESDEEDEEPWEGYDDAKLADIKKVINDDERTAEEVAYVIEYEEANGNRSTVLKALKARLAELSEEDEPEEEEEKPKARSSRRSKSSKSADPDDSDDVDKAVANDDEKEAKKGKRSTAKKKTTTDGFTVVYTLDDDDIEVDFAGINSAVGAIRDALDAGATSVTIGVS